ncbi:MAG: hypothetical protein CVV02_05475 [Firmicutes bacterium HGW-Firmicutes-7]|nr:MAG: hypothetical protein CVV02_05475 [Firmicutes bacterium HGW-Firmicutes-7]
MKNRGRFRFISLALIITYLVSFNVSLNADTTTIDYQAPIYMNKSILEDKTQVLVNDQFVVNYKFQPQDIAASNILPESYNKPKEIVMIIDTSGSMAWDVNGNSLSSYQSYKSRIALAKNSAKNFLAEIEGLSNIKVAIVEYNTDVSIKYRNSTALLPVNKSSDYSFLISSIDNLSAGGGTNVGKGMYEGFKLLQSGSTSAEKYFIFLTDGAPTYYTYYDTDKDGKKDYNESYYLTSGNTNYLKRGGTGSSDSDGKALNYGKEVGTVIKSSSMDVESYFVAFADNDAGNKLEVISDAAAGHYKKAMTGDALSDIYEELGEQISSDISIKNVYFEETFPEEFEIIEFPDNMKKVGNTIKGEFGSINYNLNAEGTYFQANPKEFKVVLKAKNVGEYVLGANDSSYIRYVDLDNTIKIKPFALVDISVYENKPPVFTASLSNSLTDLLTYTLTIDVDEDSKLEVLNIYDTIISTMMDGKVGINTFTLSEEQLVGNYLKVRSTDQFNNASTETVPIVNVVSLEQKMTAELKLQTQLNSTINKLIVNDLLVDEGRLTEGGLYKKEIQLIDGLNNLQTTATNSYGNSSRLYIVEDLQLDDLVPIIVPNYSPRFIVKGKSTLTVFIESNGTGSKIDETHYLKLPDGRTTATLADFSGIAADEDLLIQMVSDEINAISKFVPNIDNIEYKHEKFIVEENGFYAVYAKDEAGNEAVIVVEITNILDSLPGLL